MATTVPLHSQSVVYLAPRAVLVSIELTQFRVPLADIALVHLEFLHHSAQRVHLVRLRIYLALLNASSVLVVNIAVLLD